MRLSELLIEFIEDDNESLSKSFNALIKSNNGVWKSEKQAKFLLPKLKKGGDSSPYYNK